MVEVETIYRARIDYEADSDTSDAIESKAFEIGKQLEIDAFGGCAACSPYITAEGDEEAAVTIWADNLEQFITRLNGATLQP